MPPILGWVGLMLGIPPPPIGIRMPGGGPSLGELKNCPGCGPWLKEGGPTGMLGRMGVFGG